MAADLIFKNFDYKGELPTTLKEGEVYSVRMVEGNDVTRDVPLFIRKHLQVKERYFQKFLAGKKFTPTKMKIERRTLYITGPPGCGKTTLTTLLAHRYAAGAITNNAPKRVLMILFSERAHCHIFLIEGRETKKLENKVFQDEIFATVKQLLADNDTEPFDLCILDGVRDALQVCSRLIQLLNVYTGEAESIKKTIFTTSLQFMMKSGDVPMGNSRSHEEMSFDSFTEDDYLHAITNKMFLKRLLTIQPDIMDDILYTKIEGKPRLEEIEQEEEEESSEGGTGDQDAELDVFLGDDSNIDATQELEEREQGEEKSEGGIGDQDAELDVFLEDESNIDAIQEYITFKYYYAGGSARYMFEYTAFAVKSMLETLFGIVQQDEWEAFTSCTLSPRSYSVNSLMQQFKGSTTAVSKHVLFEAYDKIEGRLVSAVQAAADKSKNPALKGWAFELHQLHTMKKVLKNNSLDNCQEKVLKTKEGLCFQPVKDGEVSFNGNQLTKSAGVDLDSGTIIWCMKWNQGCFDVAFFKGNTLLTLQFTVSGVHLLKLQFIKALKDAIESNPGLEVSTCIHVGVVGDGNSTFDGFSFGAPEGAGRTSSNWHHDFTVKTYKASELMAMGGSDQQENFKATHLGDKQVQSKKRDLDQTELQAANTSSKVAKA